MTGRIRTVKPEWLDDEKLGAASDAARMLSVGLMLLADDHGRGRAHPLFVASRVWAYGDPHESLTKVSEGLAELQRIDFVRVYEVGGQSYFEIRNWLKHQKVQHPSAPRVPAPSDEDEVPPDPPTGTDRQKSLMRAQAAEKTTESTVRQPEQNSPAHKALSLRLMRPSGESHETLTPDPDPDQDPDQDQESVKRAGARPPSEAVSEVFEHWRAAMGKTRARLDPKRTGRIQWAVKTYGVADAKLAIDGCARTDWNMGRDPKTGGKTFNDIGLIFRDAAHFERFRDLGQRPATGRVEPLPNAAYRGTSQEELDRMFADVTKADLERVERGGGIRVG